jgi:ABC-type antimicrobial peptide transport system permease subunit
VALGAQRSAIYRLVLREAGWLTALGVGLGLACAVGASALMGNLLFGVRSWDPPTLLVAAAVLGLSALVASYMPARRAASIDPVQALRSDS